MPGQRKRRRRQEAASRRLAARGVPEAGRWEVVLETGDGAQLRAHVRRLQEAGWDASLIRIDTLCGRLEYPSQYRLSRFVTGPASGSGEEHADG